MIEAIRRANAIIAQQADEMKRLTDEAGKLRVHVANLLPYAYMLSRGERPIAAYADLLPRVIADAETALKP